MPAQPFLATRCATQKASCAQNGGKLPSPAAPKWRQHFGELATIAQTCKQSASHLAPAAH